MWFCAEHKMCQIFKIEPNKIKIKFKYLFSGDKVTPTPHYFCMYFFISTWNVTLLVFSREYGLLKLKMITHFSHRDKKSHIMKVICMLMRKANMVLKTKSAHVYFGASVYAILHNIFYYPNFISWSAIYSVHCDILDIYWKSVTFNLLEECWHKWQSWPKVQFFLRKSSFGII